MSLAEGRASTQTNGSRRTSGRLQLQEARIAPRQVAAREFPVAVRGYRTEEVRTYLASLAKEISWRDQEIAELQRELQRGAPRDELLEQLGMEVSSVLRSADDLQSRARDEAERIRNQAREEADGLRREAHQEIERLRADVSFLVDRFVELRDVLGQVVFGIESQLELIGEPK